MSDSIKYEDWELQVERAGRPRWVKVFAFNDPDGDAPARFEIRATSRKIGADPVAPAVARAKAKIFLGRWIRGQSYALRLPDPVTNALMPPQLMAILLQSMYPMARRGLSADIDVPGVADELSMDYTAVHSAIDRLVQRGFAVIRGDDPFRVGLTDDGMSEVESRTASLAATLNDLILDLTRRSDALQAGLGMDLQQLASTLREGKITTGVAAQAFANGVRVYLQKLISAACIALGVGTEIQPGLTVKRTQAISKALTSRTQATHLLGQAQALEALMFGFNERIQQSVHSSPTPAPRMFLYLVLFGADLLDAVDAVGNEEGPR